MIIDGAKGATEGTDARMKYGVGERGASVVDARLWTWERQRTGESWAGFCGQLLGE